MRDWVAWHNAYDDPASALATRLKLVQEELSHALDRAPAGSVRLVSLCAGQGRDVFGVLPGHRRQHDVTAVLVECNPQNAAVARIRAAEAGLTAQVEVREADASTASGFADAVPADVLLLCGIFGNVSTADIQRTVTAAAAMCTAGGTVIWTRHRRPPDLTPQLRSWFAAAGFDEVAFHAAPTGSLTSVGAHRLRDARGSVLPEDPLFTFLGSVADTAAASTVADRTGEATRKVVSSA